MSINYPPSYYRNQAHSIHSNWIETLTTLRSVTDPNAREQLLLSLKETYIDALRLMKSKDQLNGISITQLNHIVARPIQEHIAVSRHKDKNVIAIIK